MTKKTKKRPKAKPCVVWCPVSPVGQVWWWRAVSSRATCRDVFESSWPDLDGSGFTYRKFKLVEVRP